MEFAARMSVRPKPNTYRFAVGTPQSVESSIWRMWVHGNDVYLGAREALRAFKVSLHESGIWRIAWVEDLKRPDSASDRVIVKWNRPGEFAPGWTPSVGIVLSSVQPARPFKPRGIDDDRLTWFQPPASGKKLLFKVLFSPSGFTKSDLRGVSLKQDRLATCMDKSDGERVWLVAREGDLSDFERHQVRDAMSTTRIHLKPGASGDGVRGSRVLLVVSDDKPGVGTQPTIFDVSLGGERRLDSRTRRIVTGALTRGWTRRRPRPQLADLRQSVSGSRRSAPMRRTCKGFVGHTTVNGRGIADAG